MAESLPSSLVCSVCLDVCKRGAQMKCCGARACRACAVLKIYKTKRCWNEECGKENVTIATHLKNDDLLRKAVENFNKQGKVATTHKKILKKTMGGKGLEKKQIWKDFKTKKTSVDVFKKFKQHCEFGDKCKRKGCLFVHDKPTLDNRKKATVAVEKGLGNQCKKEYFNENCKIKYPAGNLKFTHPNINKPFMFVARRTACDHNPSTQAEDRPNIGIETIRNQFIPVLNGNQIKSGLGASMLGVGGEQGESMEGLVGGGHGASMDGVEGLVGGELGASMDGVGGLVGGGLGASTEELVGGGLGASMRGLVGGGQGASTKGQGGLGASMEELVGGGQGESMDRVGRLVRGGLEESMGGLVGGGTEEMAGGLEPMERRVMSTNDDWEGHNTNLKQELQRMMGNAALYGILPSYDGILGVINGINTAMVGKAPL